MRPALALTLPLILTCAAVAADLAPAAPIVKSARKIDYHASGSLPPGAEYHLMYEDKTTHAISTLVRMPSGYFLPPHSHRFDELLFILKGKLILSFNGREQTLNVGDYAVIPAETDFTMRAMGFSGAQFIASFNGPFDVKFAAPAAP